MSTSIPPQDKGKSPASTSTSSLPPLANVLNASKSPYLLQHKSNPVHWQEWNAASIERAVREDKMIFLSVGYSSCHWCHVQAAESFSNEHVAEIMNKYFINIKVDREERPDVDRMYMTYLQATSGGGGWPMSLFLTPTLEPVFAGTYFTRGKFLGLLDKINELWQDERERVLESGRSVIEQLQDMQSSEGSGSSLDVPALVTPAIDKIFLHLSKGYDPAHGGFSKRGPKFPSPAQNLVILSRIAADSHGINEIKADERERGKGEKAAEMGMRMLRALWMGGIRDWVGNGLARYSVDEYWRLPHFEKMLYDQGQVCLGALEFSLLPNLPEPQGENRKICLDLAADIIQYVARVLVSPGGGIYSAEDADSGESFEHPERHSEGAFYVWMKQEFDDILGEEAEIAATFWNVKQDGNVNPAHDAHDELKGKNTLYQTLSYEEVATKHETSPDKVREIIARSITKLKAYRDETRPRPHLDDKILVSWNGLMINALAQAAVILPSEQYPIAKKCREIAENSVDFIRREMYDESMGELVRSWREGKGPKAQADDYSYFIASLLSLYNTTGHTPHLIWANQLQGKMDELFWDGEGEGGYWASQRDELVKLRLKEAQDGAEPSASSITLQNLLQLSLFFPSLSDDYQRKREGIIRSMEGMVRRAPFAVTTGVVGAWEGVRGVDEYIIVGAPDSEFITSIRQTLHSTTFLPRKIIIHLDPTSTPASTPLTSHPLAKDNPVIQSILQELEKEREKTGGKVRESLRVCRGFSCGLPVYGVEEGRREILGR